MVMNVPRELLADDADDEGFVFGRDGFDARRPRRERVADEKDHLHDRDGDLGALRDLALRARVAGNRIGAAAETEDDVNEENAPPDEQHQHEPVHERQHVIDLTRVR